MLQILVAAPARTCGAALAPGRACGFDWLMDSPPLVRAWTAGRVLADSARGATDTCCAGASALREGWERRPAWGRPRSRVNHRGETSPAHAGVRA